MALGEVVRRRRLELGLTQHELAARSGLSRPAIAAIETGRIALPGRDELASLAGALRVTVLDLLAASGYGEVLDPRVLSFASAMSELPEPDREGVWAVIEVLLRCWPRGD